MSNRSSFSPPVRAYAGGFLILLLLLIGGLVIFAMEQWRVLEQQSEQRGHELAREELAFAVGNLLERSQDLARNLATWDETIQQLGTPTFYQYWRQQRVASLGFLPTYFDELELYDRRGMPLGSSIAPGMPRQVTRSDLGAVLIKDQDHEHLLLVAPIMPHLDIGSPAGYLVLRIDFKGALYQLQKFRYIDFDTLQLTLAEDHSVAEDDIVDHLQFSVLPSEERKKLANLFQDTLINLGFAGAALALLFLTILGAVVGVPVQRLSHLVDQARASSLNDPLHSRPTRVAEFERIADSLKQYHRELGLRDAALQESTARMSAVLKNAADAIITLDEHYCIENVNPAGERLFGYSERELLGVQLSELLTNDAAFQLEQLVRAEASRGAGAFRPAPLELEGIRDGGEKFQLDLRLSRMHWAEQRRYIALLRDITERKRTEQNLVQMANFDGLTGLPNRVLFRDRLGHALARARRDKTVVGLVFLDLDRFKTVNDSLGHQSGDALLAEVARRMQSCMREGDTIARLGGDEFTVVTEGIHSKDDTIQVVSRLLAALSDSFVIGGQELFISASAGITFFPQDDQALEGLLRNADTAMYRAKALGGNNHQVFTRDMVSMADDRLALEADLRHALFEEAFELHYQPRVDTRTGECTGVEALLRWNHPKHGWIPPSRFIPILEETGLILDVGAWVFREACRQVRDWRQRGLQKLRVAVNLSARQFRQHDLVESIAAVISEMQLPAEMLELEITEGLLVDDAQDVNRVLERLHELGVHVSIDDFGTGYSSLNYLKRFSIDTLKIDQSFVRDLPHDPDDSAIVITIIAMARSLRLGLVAEGVETEAQLAFLKAHGCEEIQGYLAARPLHPTDFEQWLSTHSPCWTVRTA